MKILPVVFVITFISFVFAIFPSWLIYLNYSLDLPVYNFTFLKILGVLFILKGVAICLYCIMTFIKQGRGTPVPFDPPRKFVASGLYRFSRNPMYLGSLAIVLGEFLLFGHALLLFYFLSLAPVYHAYIVLFEEPGLKKRFGQAYEEYLRKTPRWL